jgi:hypothetical protein
LFGGSNSFPLPLYFQFHFLCNLDFQMRSEWRKEVS